MPHVFSKKLMWLLRGQLLEKFDYFLCHGLVTLLLGISALLSFRFLPSSFTILSFDSYTNFCSFNYGLITSLPIVFLALRHSILK